MKSLVIILVSLFFCALRGHGQEMDTTIRISVQACTGWVHYNNNLVIGHNSVKNDFVGSSFRIMWEPEHRLSLGLETGYYKLYEVTLEDGDGSGASLSIIPIMATIRMRMFKNFYVTGGSGIVAMDGKINSPGNNSSSRVFSYSNVQLSGLYLYKITQQFSVGGEMKFLWIDKTNDSMYSLQAVVSWRF